MGHQTHGAFRKHQYTMPLQPARQRLPPCGIKPHKNHIGRHAQHLETRQRSKASSQLIGLGVIQSQPARAFAQGDQPGCGHDACLAHATTCHLAPAARCIDPWPPATQHRANGRPQALGQADGDRIEWGGKLPGWHAMECRSVEQPSAVEMHGQAMGIGQRPGLLGITQG